MGGKGSGGDHHPVFEGNEDYTSSTGNIRCKRIKKDGTRCNKMAIRGLEVCGIHGGSIKHLQMSKYAFKTQQLQTAYEEFLVDPDILDCKDELALTRTCLQAILSRIKDMDLETLSGDAIGSITMMAKDVTEIAERISKIEKGMKLHINVEHLQMVTSQIVDIVSTYIDDDEKLEELVQRLFDIDIPTGGRKPAPAAKASKEIQ